MFPSSSGISFLVSSTAETVLGLCGEWGLRTQVSINVAGEVVIDIRNNPDNEKLHAQVAINNGKFVFARLDSRDDGEELNIVVNGIVLGSTEIKCMLSVILD